MVPPLAVGPALSASTRRRRAAFAAVVLGLALSASGQAAPDVPRAGIRAPQFAWPPVGLNPRDLALVVNDADPASVEVGRHYAWRRGIAPDRVVHVRFPAGQAELGVTDFERVAAEVRAKLPASVQAYALAWTLPYRVGCMSVTSAFAFGYDQAYCATGCQTTKPSPYFDSPSNLPFTDHGLRPAMLLAGTDVAAAKALIDRGLRSDARWPAGTAYLLSTGDRKRNVRSEGYAQAKQALAESYPVRRVDADTLVDKRDVMFYFTGVKRVDGMTRNRYLDGAIADHLTSFGGVLTGSSQTSALEWLSAGATGSYGTTSEPCNYRGKFPEIAVVMGRYTGGETLLEAYWKSVRMPGQGVFVGDPLARPFGGVRLMRAGTGWRVRTRLLRPGTYLLQSAPGLIGPFRTVGRLEVARYGTRDIQLPGAGVHRLVPASGAAP